MNSLRLEIGALYQDLGFWQALARLLAKLLSCVYAQYEELVLAKDLRDAKRTSAPTQLSIEPITEKHIPGLIQSDPRHARKLAHFVNSPRKGFLATLEGETVGYVWWIDKTNTPKTPRSGTALNRLQIDLQEGEVYLFDFFLSRPSRHSGNAAAFLVQVWSALHKLGYERAYGAVHSNNRRARWTYASLGWTVIRRTKTRKFFSLFMVSNKKILTRRLWRSAPRGDNHTAPTRVGGRGRKEGCAASQAALGR